jgi:hypothetical protein
VRGQHLASDVAHVEHPSLAHQMQQGTAGGHKSVAESLSVARRAGRRRRLAVGGEEEEVQGGEEVVQLSGGCVWT